MTSRRMSRPARPYAVAALAGAATLIAAALLVRWQSRRAEQEHPPIGRFVQIDGVRLHYLERGRGEPLVLLHGNGTMIQDFATSGLIDLAAERYRVIVFDRPGYGYSERPRSTIWTPAAQADLLHAALQRLGAGPATVLGHSWGASVAVALALQHPEAVSSLVLASGYYYPTVRADAPLLAGPAIPVLGDLMRYTISPLLGRIMWPAVLRKLFGPAQVPASFAALAGMSLRPVQLRATSAESALMIPDAFALRGQYGALKMPVVIVAGADDRLVTAERQSARLHSEVPQSTLHVAPGVGHMVHHTVPHLVMAAIDEAARAANREQSDGVLPAEASEPPASRLAA